MIKDPLQAYILAHLLQFGENEPIQIAEPVGFDAANLVTRQDKDRLGRDVSFASGNVDLTFDNLTEFEGLTHNLEKLLSEYKENGFEADVKYILRLSNDGVNYSDFILGQLDFGQPETDSLTFFSCKVIQENQQALLKRRLDTAVNIFGSETVDGDYLAPLAPEKVLIRATPIIQESVWDESQGVSGAMATNEEFAVCFTPVISKSEIESTLSPINGIFFASDTADLANMVFLEAQNTLKNNKLVMEGFSYDAAGANDNTVKLKVRYGDSFDTAQQLEYDVPNDTSSYSNTITLPPIERNERLWIYFSILNTGVTNFNFERGKFTLTTEATALSSVTSGVKYIDAFRKVLSSISGLSLRAPQFEQGSELLPQYIFDGILLRNISDQEFNISLKDLIEQLNAEWNGDYEIEDNNILFIGLFDEFYRNESIGKFEQVPTEEYREPVSEQHAIKDFMFKYKKYEKTNDEEKSREGVHTSMETLLPNRFADNSKKLDVPFIRDAFLIEKTRKDAIRITDDTATENDEDIFILDVIEKSVSFSETLKVNHVVESGTDLVLINDGTFNWQFLGISVNDFIEITGQNGGDWRVLEIGDKKLVLTAVGGSTATYSGLELITIDYNVTATNLTNRTDEGFDLVTNTTSPSGFSNLRFTPKRNTLKYWGDYLGTSTFYHKDFGDSIKVTEFIHNGGLETRRSDESFSIVEDSDIGTKFLPRTLEPKEVNTVVYCSFLEYVGLANKLRKKRGFVEIVRPSGEIVKVHPTLLDFDISEEVLNIVGTKRNPN